MWFTTSSWFRTVADVFVLDMFTAVLFVFNGALLSVKKAVLLKQYWIIATVGLISMVSHPIISGCTDDVSIRYYNWDVGGESVYLLFLGSLLAFFYSEVRFIVKVFK